MRPRNLLILMADEHRRDAMGSAGHPLVRTPNLDSLASRGVRFESAYCNSPLCVPSRASLVTGRYVHQIGAWDNASSYDGSPASFGHRLTEHGVHVTTVGKLHFGQGSDHGFPDERIPQHISGAGDVLGLIRDRPVRRPGAAKRLTEAGPGDTDHIAYDRAITERSVEWLRTEARGHAEPWVLWVSWLAPHFPLIVPREYFDLYPPDAVGMPIGGRREADHPVLEGLRVHFDIDREVDEHQVRRARAAYFALCTFMDTQVGRVLAALDEAVLRDETRIVYTSDHGDSIGEHGLWWKCNMYEGSVGVPLLLVGPDVPSGHVVRTPVSLVDLYLTVLDAVGVSPADDDVDLPGRSLWEMAAEPNAAPQRAIFSEYHAHGSIAGMFMLRVGDHKLVYYPGYAPQLFDLRVDPHELHDLAGRTEHAPTLRRLETELRAIVDPEAIDARAKAEQREKLGGISEAVRERALGPGVTAPLPDFRS